MREAGVLAPTYESACNFIMLDHTHEKPCATPGFGTKALTVSWWILVTGSGTCVPIGGKLGCGPVKRLVYTSKSVRENLLLKCWRINFQRVGSDAKEVTHAPSESVLYPRILGSVVDPHLLG